MKILITGGHITPALAVIEEISKRGSIDVVVVGRKYALDHENVESFEYKTLSKRGIKFVNLSAGRLTRTLSVQTLLNFIRFPGGFLKSLAILREEKPDKILSFGGYIALPISLCAYLLHIPVYTHEQTMRAGLTNKIISKVAKKIFVSYEETKKYFPSNKTVLTGNPIRGLLIDSTPEVQSHRPLLYITGGSLGSHSINIHIEHILDELHKTFTVIHQTGNVAEFGDYERLKKRAGPTYIVKEHVKEDEIAQIYSKADLVVCRSGANTVSELIVLNKPSVLIPLPWSSNGEQQAQAEFLHQAGVAEIFNQKHESSHLLDRIHEVYTHRKEYSDKFSHLAEEKKLIQHAATVIVDQVLAV